MNKVKVSSIISIVSIACIIFADDFWWYLICMVGVFSGLVGYVGYSGNDLDIENQKKSARELGVSEEQYERLTKIQ